MTIQEVNAKTLSNGMNRKDYFDSVVDWYSQGAMEFNGYFRKQVNIPYDTVSDRQKYDVYMPMKPGLYPTVLLVHGGGWFTGDRSDFGLSLCLPYIAHGFTVITIGYRLADEGVYPDPVDDVCKAMKQIFAHAEEYGVDVNRVAMQAGSAGTTIAALAALRNPDLIKSVILRCAILDFSSIRSQYEQIGLERERFKYPDEDTSIEALFMGGSTLELPEVAKQCNPATHLTPDCPYFLLIHGLVDVDTPYPQSINFARQIREATGDNSRAELVLLAETGHDNGRYDDPSTFETQLDFLKCTLL